MVSWRKELARSSWPVLGFEEPGPKLDERRRGYDMMCVIVCAVSVQRMGKVDVVDQGGKKRETESTANNTGC